MRPALAVDDKFTFDLEGYYRVRGTFLPGMYADIFLVLAQPTERLVLPSTAIVFSSFGDSVYVVEPGEGGGHRTLAHPALAGDELDAHEPIP